MLASFQCFGDKSYFGAVRAIFLPAGVALLAAIAVPFPGAAPLID